MCGYEGAKRDSHKWFVDHVRERFERAYQLNVESVNAQYDDCTMLDEESYDAEFEAYRKAGELIYREGYGSSNGIIFEQVAEVMSKKSFRKAMWKFFDSVLYQIENDAAHREVSELFYACLNKLYDNDVRDIDGWWGEIELKAA